MGKFTVHLALMSAFAVSPAFAFDQPASTSANEPNWTDLKDEPSRAQLGDYEMQHFGPPGTKAARRNFMFPADAGDGFYGIDVSHHNGAVDWQNVKAAGVRFVYLKATQGASYRDGTFLGHWSTIGSIGGIRRGAYHFLSAGISGKDQAKSYLAMLQRAGGLADTDLTPVLDMEWDVEHVNGPDRWARYSSAQIAQVALDWLTTVKEATGRTPMIYTARSWWAPRLGNNNALAAYPQWLNDFRVTSFTNGAPVSVPGHQYRTWQFTDVGRLPSGMVRVDVNKLRYRDLDTLSGK